MKTVILIMGTMVHPDYLGQGIFTKSATHLYENTAHNDI